ncbi:MAG: hypothetical protein ACKOB8_07160 [Mycobacterium sp.]
MSRITVAGAALAATGLAHFAKPELFEPITAPVFPDNTRRHIYLNGGIETALGVGLVVPQTRKIAVAGALGYLGYLALAAVRSRG